MQKHAFGLHTLPGNMRRFSLGIIVVLAVSGCMRATAPATSVPHATAAFVLHGEGETRVLTYEGSTKTLRLFGVQDDVFVEQASIHSPATPHRATTLQGDIVVAYGYGRGTLEDPVTVVRYDGNLGNPTTIFTYTSERSEVTQLLAVDGTLFVGHFTSKYDTVAGWLRADGVFDERIRTRLGMQYDVRGDLIVQGRPYGDTIGEDGDVTLFRGTGAERLPSFRGVSGVRLGQADDDPEPEIFIGDGWHQNYGQFAEPRLSMLDKRGDTYALETLAVLAPQHSISEIVPFTMNGGRYVFASGNARADIVNLADRSVQNLLRSDDIYFQALLLDIRGTTVRVLVLEEQGARMVSVALVQFESDE